MAYIIWANISCLFWQVLILFWLASLFILVVPHTHTHTGIFFMYDLSPMMVQLTEHRRSFAHFLTGVCAIVGGVFTVAGMLDGMLYHSARALRKKIDLGKASWCWVFLETPLRHELIFFMQYLYCVWLVFILISCTYHVSYNQNHVIGCVCCHSVVMMQPIRFYCVSKDTVSSI